MLKKKLYAYRNGFLHGVRTNKDGILGGEKKRFRVQKRVVLVKFNQGFNFNGGGGGDRRGDGTTARVLGNLALAVGLTYLTMTGQLGWVLDTIVSLWVIFFLSLNFVVVVDMLFFNFLVLILYLCFEYS